MESKMQCEEIETLISEGLKCVRAQVLSDDGTHFEALVVSEEFEGQARIRRHQMVYATLGALMGREIHAMSIQAMTPQEWAARLSSNR
jgi:acid stress-induced BolA-like protein IbaG/YrbA